MPRRAVVHSKCPHVAVCVDTGRAHGRGVLKGIADYVEAFGPWSLFLDPQADSNQAGGRSKDWHGDGILTYVRDAARAERLRRRGIPTVELFAYRDDGCLPLVANDDYAIGRLAAGHLLERQFRSFAFTGYRRSVWSGRRRSGFLSTLRGGGFPEPFCLELEKPENLPAWEQVQQQLTDWLKGIA